MSKYKTFTGEEILKLEDLYTFQQLSPRQIGEIYNKNGTTIMRWLKLCSIPLREMKERMILRNQITIQNNIARHGVASMNSLESVKTNKRKALMQKYGVDNIFKTQALKDQRIKVLGKWNNSEIVDKIREGHNKKYGCHYRQTKKGFNEARKASFKLKEYILPSGKIIQLQGYEPQVLDILLNKYEESDICFDTTGIPSIPYQLEDKNKVYFPDFFIPKENKIVEVKSKHTLKSDTAKNKAKHKAAKLLGYDHRFLVYDAKTKLVSEVIFNE